MHRTALPASATGTVGQGSTLSLRHATIGVPGFVTPCNALRTVPPIESKRLRITEPLLHDTDIGDHNARMTLPVLTVAPAISLCALITPDRPHPPHSLISFPFLRP